MKRFILLLVCILLLAGCQSDKTANLDGKKGSRELYCEQEQEKGADLNLNGCFYNEMEQGISSILFFPDGVLSNSKETSEDYLPWAHVISQNTFVTSENHNIDYFMDILSNILLDNDKFSFVYTDNSIEIELDSKYAYAFCDKYNLYTRDESNTKIVDSPGMTQVLAQCLADTIYSNFPEIDVVSFLIPGIDTLTPATGEEIINKKTLLPMYYGSENNYIGELSFQDYMKALEDNGIKFRNYSEKDYLWVVNTYVYTAN